jgi:hypothetical protein
MPNQESQHDDFESQDALELNKETLQDLDLDATDQENVKGGLGTASDVIKTISEALSKVTRTG